MGVGGVYLQSGSEIRNVGFGVVRFFTNPTSLFHLFLSSFSSAIRFYIRSCLNGCCGVLIDIPGFLTVREHRAMITIGGTSAYHMYVCSG